MKAILVSAILVTSSLAALANTAPTPVVVSAAMRAGTTLMDIVYRVDDPDDATVTVRALAFINGTRSFANVIKPVTLVEGTAANLGDAITTNTEHTLTWDVGADWKTDVGQLKFEVLALDQRGLLAFDWITIPAANGQPALTISKDTPNSTKMLDALFWEYAAPTPKVTLANGVLVGNALSGALAGVTLASGSTPQTNAPLLLFRSMNLDAATLDEVNYANTTARAGLLNTGSWHAANRVWTNRTILVGWGANQGGELSQPFGLSGVTSVATGAYHSLALKSDGTVVAWGNNNNGQTSVPSGLSGVTAIAASSYHCLALKSDGTVVAWGSNSNGESNVPAGLTGVTAIAAGTSHCLALKSDGTVVAWGYNGQGQCTVPANLTGVTAVAAGGYHSLALKNDGTVVAWGFNNVGQCTIPAGLTGVTAIATGLYFSLAVKSDGTVVAWGANDYGQCTVPDGLSGVIAVAGGYFHCLALKNDGTVVVWGDNSYGQTNIPAGLNHVTNFTADTYHSLALTTDTP